MNHEEVADFEDQGGFGQSGLGPADGSVDKSIISNAGHDDSMLIKNLPVPIPRGNSRKKKGPSPARIKEEDFMLDDK